MKKLITIVSALISFGCSQGDLPSESRNNAGLPHNNYFGQIQTDVGQSDARVSSWKDGENTESSIDTSNDTEIEVKVGLPSAITPCSDSDGYSFYTKGVAANIFGEKVIDTCMKGFEMHHPQGVELGFQYVGSCTPPNCRATDSFCYEGNSTIYNGNADCPSGCFDGVCLPTKITIENKCQQVKIGAIAKDELGNIVTHRNECNPDFPNGGPVEFIEHSCNEKGSLLTSVKLCKNTCHYIEGCDF
ncbi:hypothetical protein HOD05_04075 [Candidatus Woesearchaeota archaeon]|jgi:hypothetical protein|nr:hypothetical protein [Candidatus Woesearchaeota archaeon]MBT4151215.1 hypothetical protein [Candidatus Woesearchaeota archaeon]MBT4247663.1 hypothetical protein [Candidatus Woesearchaeota archaeon]MBT4434372.1 hypothetical protein [Candidatus Woesearchaeota archaeon]MBT7331735.1 hypothetical protein [Candidatus Woesearchaeota archaeon]